MSACSSAAVEDGEVPALDAEIGLAYDTHGEGPDLLTAVDEVLVSHGVDEARAAFERAGARDFLGREAEAIPLYRDALELGLAAPLRVQCLVQLGSSLRNTGDPDSAVEVLRAAGAEAMAEERAWCDAFLALALHARGDSTEALAVALQALAPHLSRYERAVVSYADAL